MADEAVSRIREEADTLLSDQEVFEKNEKSRLDVLKSYSILDTDREPAFDRIVGLAQVLFNAPIALVSFIDEERQWFKARVGLDVAETPREHAFCDHVIRQTDVMVVPDARQDERFANNPLVTGDPNIRFYAGAPMITPGGARLGTVCIISPDPRPELGPDDRRRLQALADIAANELELRRKSRQAELLTLEIEHRVKTTLRFVTRILEMQAARIEDRQVRRQVLEAVDRISGVEVLQRHLRHGGAVFETDARDYLLSLMLTLQETLVPSGQERPVFVTCAESFAISPDGIATLGMVAVELVTNALKHGRGAVQVDASLIDGVVVVSVTDEGRGPSAEQRRLSSENNTGLHMVSMLALPGGLSIDPARPHCVTARLAA